MRAIFNQNLTQLGDDLRRMSKYVAKAMRRARTTIVEPDLALAEQIITNDQRIDILHRDLDDMCINLLALQAPVATDLRSVVSAMRISQTLERQGDLARHLAEISRSAFPSHVGPPAILAIFTQMADICVQMADKVTELVDSHDMELAANIQDDDDALDELHLQVRQYLADETQQLTRQQVIDVVLMDRFLERFGDHSSAVARRIVFLVTGKTVINS